MNVKMYESAVVQDNLACLRRRGFQIMESDTGEMACGAYGSGRLPDPSAIVEALATLLSVKDLNGYQILVSAGPTHEDLDPVRFLTNRSTGKMGYALAKMARRRGAEVCLVSGPSSLTPPPGVELVQVRSALEMHQALASRFPQSDALIMSAAVGDYRPVGFAEQKIKRDQEEMLVKLTRNPDILESLGAHKSDKVMVGFAAETQDILLHAQQKLERKHLDLIVANDVSAPDSGFAVDTNRVTLIHRTGEVESLPLLSKEDAADRVLDRVAVLLAEQPR
jgi:phosphopantothenoylcysteine decarboxylase/phosphopantothenate--cysteine ligase